MAELSVVGHSIAAAIAIFRFKVSMIPRSRRAALRGSFFISWERSHERPSDSGSDDLTRVGGSLMTYQIKPLSCDPAKIKGMS